MPLGTRFYNFQPPLYIDHILSNSAPQISKCNLFIVFRFLDQVSILFMLLRIWDSIIIKVIN